MKKGVLLWGSRSNQHRDVLQQGWDVQCGNKSRKVVQQPCYVCEGVKEHPSLGRILC